MKKQLRIQSNTNTSPDNWSKRILVFIPTRGTVRMEWVLARYGQIVPINWSYVDLVQYVSSYAPIKYQLADAQNLMAKTVVEHDYDWVLYIEDDNVLPPDALVKLNQYMNEKKYPVVSGLYFTKAVPSEPLIFRGRGNSYYGDWKIGEKVFCDGIPFGCRLEHAGLIKEAWKDSPEYRVGDVITRRVFSQPTHQWFDPEKGGIGQRQGTTDLEWCTRIIEDKLLERAGFPEIQKMKYPFLVDTTLFVKHIDEHGKMYPDPEYLLPFLPDAKRKEIERMAGLDPKWRPVPEGKRAE